MISLYIHIPFCVKKCGYCDFISFEYDENALESYLKDLESEIKYYGITVNEKVHTIFIGGGTPSLLSGNQMKRLMQAIGDVFDMSECKEVSMESNPGTLTLEKLLAYKEAGINRISMGVQTLNDKTLKTLDRIHDVNQVYESVSLIKEAGFANYNMDLMFGLPGQTLEMLKETVDKMIALEPTHISAYSLKFEEGTAFYKKLEEGTLNEIDDDLDRDMYHLIERKLLEAHYHQYEISNFSKSGFECCHNLVYWEKEAYLGIGVGAHGYHNKIRTSNAIHLEAYHDMIRKQRHGQVSVEVIDKEEDLFEMLILGLRLNKGLSIKKIKALYDVDILEKYEMIIKELEEKRLIEVKDGRITLTALGRDLSNQVFMAFLD